MRALLAAVATIALGLASRRFLSGLPAKLAGDALYTVLLYTLVLAARPRVTVRTATIIAFGVSTALELLQLTPISAWLSAQHVLLRLIFGTTFGAVDLAGYALGAIGASLAHAFFRPPRLFFLGEPSAAVIAERLSAQETRTGGGTLKTLAEHSDVASIDPAAFTRVKDAIASFAHYPAWTRVSGTGDRRVVVIRALGVWSVHAFEISEIMDEPDRFALTIATLGAHAEAGDECFAVERTQTGVRVSIVSHSRPAHALARLGAPLVSLLQRRFVREALEGMISRARPSR